MTNTHHTHSVWCVNICAGSYTAHTHTHTHTHRHTHTLTYKQTHTHTNQRMHIHTRSVTHPCMQTNIHRHKHTHQRVLTHTHIKAKQTQTHIRVCAHNKLSSSSPSALSPLLPPPGLYKPRCRNPGMAGDKRQSGSNTSDIQRWLLFSVFSLVTHGRGVMQQPVHGAELKHQGPPNHLKTLKVLKNRGGKCVTVQGVKRK